MEHYFYVSLRIASRPYVLFCFTYRRWQDDACVVLKFFIHFAKESSLSCLALQMKHMVLFVFKRKVRCQISKLKNSIS